MSLVECSRPSMLGLRFIEYGLIYILVVWLQRVLRDGILRTICRPIAPGVVIILPMWLESEFWRTASSWCEVCSVTGSFPVSFFGTTSWYVKPLEVRPGGSVAMVRPGVGSMKRESWDAETGRCSLSYWYSTSREGRRYESGDDVQL
jgi:hypothetical protein